MPTALSYQSSGSHAAQTILFLHGGGAAGWMWDPVVARLQDFHCLVPDLPEHGGSMETRPFSIELAACQAAELVREQAHGGKAVVVGLSEGAQVAVHMLAAAPERIERAVISSALLLPLPGSSWIYTPRLLAWMFRLSVAPFRHNDWWIRLNMKYSAAMPESFYPQFRANFQAMTESQFVNLMLANQRFRLPANLENIAVPALVIAGKHEYGVMKASARQLAAALPNAAGRWLDLGKSASMASEHNWAVHAPDLFAQTIRGFIDGSELPAVLRPFE